MHFAFSPKYLFCTAYGKLRRSLEKILSLRIHPCTIMYIHKTCTTLALKINSQFIYTHIKFRCMSQGGCKPSTRTRTRFARWMRRRGREGERESGWRRCNIRGTSSGSSICVRGWLQCRRRAAHLIEVRGRRIRGRARPRSPGGPMRAEVRGAIPLVTRVLCLRRRGTGAAPAPCAHYHRTRAGRRPAWEIVQWTRLMRCSCWMGLTYILTAEPSLSIKMATQRRARTYRSPGAMQVRSALSHICVASKTNECDRVWNVFHFLIIVALGARPDEALGYVWSATGSAQAALF